MQAGSVHALEDDDWIFPSYRESAIGLLRGMPAATVLSWWRGHPAGWWNPADYNLASICVPIATHVPHAAGLAWGKRLRGETRVRARRSSATARPPRARSTRARTSPAVMRAPLVLLCNNNQWAISTPLSAQTHAEALVDKAAGYGIPGTRVDGGDVLAVYEATREAVARARAGEGPTFIEAVTYRAAPHATADDPKAYIDPRARRGGARERVPRAATRATSAGAESSTTTSSGRSGPRPRDADARRDRGRRGRAAGRTSASSSSTRSSTRPRRSRTTSPSCGGSSVAELLLVEAVNDALHVEMERDERRASSGRGRRPRRRRLSGDRGPARPLRRRPLRRHAARRSRDPRLGGRALHGRLPAGLRDAVRRVLVSLPRPADHPRRPLPLAHRREDDLPDHDPDAVRRRRPRARAARRLARDLLRPHARDQGRDPVDAGRRKGPARGRDPRSRPGRDSRAEARLPHRARRGARRRARRSARKGAARP